MKESLEKLINKIIVPLYDIVSEVEVSKWTNHRGDITYYKVTYFLNWRINFKVMSEIEMETRSLFNLLGPNQNEILDIDFRRSESSARL